MKQSPLFRLVIGLALITTSFGLGYGVRSAVQKPATAEPARVIAIGGVFFKSKNPAELKKWYSTHLGLRTDQYGTNFEWRYARDSAQKGHTQWSPFNEKTTYFAPSTKEFMMNYMVEDLEWLALKLKEEGVTLVDSVEVYEYGKFLHIMDPEGNKIELYQPIYGVLEYSEEGITR